MDLILILVSIRRDSPKGRARNGSQIRPLMNLPFGDLYGVLSILQQTRAIHTSFLSSNCHFIGFGIYASHPL